jgi:uncharacterized protein YggE
MKRIVAAVVFFLAVSNNAFGQELSSLPMVTTNGEAEIRVIPDEVIVSLGVETSNKLLGLSKNQNDERVKRIMAVAAKLGVDAKYIQTDFINVEPWHRRGQEYPESLEYRVRKTLAITLKETSKFETLISQALEAGATNIHGVQFRTTELRKHRDAARALAIKAAHEKAVALATSLGQRVGKPYRISESGSGWYSPYGWWSGYGYGRGMTQNVIQNSGEAASTDGTLPLGQISITANVSVSFMLE